MVINFSTSSYTDKFAGYIHRTTGDKKIQTAENHHYIVFHYLTANSQY